MNSSTYELDGWILAQVEGKTYLGKPTQAEWLAELSAINAAVRLAPVYEFAWMVLPTAQGPIQQPTLRPPFGCTSVASVTLPRPGIWVALAALSRDEQKVFAQLVHATEEGLRQARAAASGLTLAPAGTKLPPMQHPHGNGRR